MKTVFWVSAVLIFYVYFGYPFLIALMAMLKKKKKYKLADLPNISLIIAAYNEEAVIGKKLENSFSLNYPEEKLEIIVAADGSSDKTMEIVQTYDDRGVILSYMPDRKGKMAAISRAIKVAKGEILVFSDANNFYEEITFKYLMQPFADKVVGGTTGAKRVCDENDQLSRSEGLYWKYESWIKKNESRLNTCTASTGEIFAMRKCLFKQPSQKIINDDFYMLLSILKQGLKVVYVPEAKSWERVSADEQDEIRRRKRINAGRYQALFNAYKWLPWKKPIAIWQIISHKIFRLFTPFFMIFGFVSNIWLAILEMQNQSNFYPDYSFRLLFLGQLIFFLTAIIYPLVPQIKGYKVLYLPVFLVNSNIAALQGFFSYISGGQSSLWERVKRRTDD